jgi:predicted MPP superfamily phosphohydrolase
MTRSSEYELTKRQPWLAWPNWRKLRDQIDLDGRINTIVSRRFAGHISHSEMLSSPIIVAHLTDLHVGMVTPMTIQMKAVSMTNAAQPDLVVLTGDFVAHSLAYLSQLTEIVAAIDAPTYAVLGNHDHATSATHITAALQEGGVTVLTNECLTIEIGENALQLVGVDDAYTSHTNVEEATENLDPDIPSLGLSHIPEVADALWAQGVPLVLSGHTHGGQVALGHFHELTVGKMAGHKYVHGLYGSRMEKAPLGAVYVNAGIGAAVMPLRLGDRGQKELAIFELGTRPGTLEEDHVAQTALSGRKPTPWLKRRRKRLANQRAIRRQARLNRGRLLQRFTKDR